MYVHTSFYLHAFTCPCAAPPDIVLRKVKIEVSPFSCYLHPVLFANIMRKAAEKKSFCIVLVLICCCGECANG